MNRTKKTRTLKQRIFALHERGHCLDVWPIRPQGNKLLCRFRNDATGGDLKKISPRTLSVWEEEADMFDANTNN